jgi:RND family efflux transporter MFP subunit
MFWKTTLIALLCTAKLLTAQEPEAEKPAQETAPKILRSKTAILTWIDQIDLPARDAGSLDKLLVQEGQIVQADQLLGELDRAEQLAERAKAELELAIAKQKADTRVQLEYAQVSHQIAVADLARAKEAIAKFAKSVSQTEVDQAQLAVDKTRLEIKQAEEVLAQAKLEMQLKEQELKLIQAKLQRRMLHAPFAGMVAQRYKQAGEWVQPGDKVLRLLRTDRLRVETFLPQHDVPANLSGAKVRFLITKADEQSTTIPGTVTFVSPEVNPVNGQIRIWAEVENPEHTLRAGQAGQLEIELPATP